jgi:hypothetical protein
MLQRQGLERHQSRKTCERGRETWTTSQENPVNQQSQGTHAEAEPETVEQLAQEYYCVFIDKSCKVELPVPDCPGRYSGGRKMRVHFRDRHPDNTIVVEQEGRFPRCVRCNMFAETVGTMHRRLQKCARRRHRGARNREWPLNMQRWRQTLSSQSMESQSR